MPCHYAAIPAMHAFSGHDVDDFLAASPYSCRVWIAGPATPASFSLRRSSLRFPARVLSHRLPVVLRRRLINVVPPRPAALHPALVRQCVSAPVFLSV